MPHLNIKPLWSYFVAHDTNTIRTSVPNPLEARRSITSRIISVLPFRFLFLLCFLAKLNTCSSCTWRKARRSLPGRRVRRVLVTEIRDRNQIQFAHSAYDSFRLRFIHKFVRKWFREIDRKCRELIHTHTAHNRFSDFRTAAAKTLSRRDVLWMIVNLEETRDE